MDVNLLYKSKQLAAHADDINCLTRSSVYLKEMFVKLEKAVRDIGL